MGQSISQPRHQILQFIYVHQAPVSTRGVADKIQISWKKADKLLNELFHEGYLQKKRTEGGTNYWKENE